MHYLQPRPAFLLHPRRPFNQYIYSISVPVSQQTPFPVAITHSRQAGQQRTCSHNSKPLASHSPCATSSGSSRQILQKAARRSYSKSPLLNHKEGDHSNMTARHDPVKVALNSNSEWRRNLAETNPDIFTRMGKGQAPEILWIGCADSRCPETTILGLQPGDVFCHRNIANILVPTDLNSLSVIQYAVQYLKVKHVIVCGHTSCGGVAAALDNKALGLIDTWLMPLRAIRQSNSKMLESLDPTERALKLVDLNVRNSISTLLANPTVISAIAERGLKVHGMIFDVASGEVNELDITEDDEIIADRVAAFRTG